MIGERIKKLRKTLDLTQQEFASKIGVKRNTVATYEMGRTEPSASGISLICREFGVSETWLRNGEGEMFIKPTRALEINEFISKALQDKPESFKLRLISALSRLRDDDWEVLERFAADLAGKTDGSIVPVSSSIAEMTAEEAHAELDRQLRDEKELEEGSQALQNSNSSGAKLA